MTFASNIYVITDGRIPFFKQACQPLLGSLVMFLIACNYIDWKGNFTIPLNMQILCFTVHWSGEPYSHFGSGFFCLLGIYQWWFSYLLCHIERASHPPLCRLIFHALILSVMLKALSSNPVYVTDFLGTFAGLFLWSIHCSHSEQRALFVCKTKNYQAQSILLCSHSAYVASAHGKQKMWR
jgi:hypothetical protein